MIHFLPRRIERIVLIALSLWKHFADEMHDFQIGEALVTRFYLSHDVFDGGIDFYLFVGERNSFLYVLI